MLKIITIDGLASSGKSTLSRLLAEKINWKWLSSGVLYRGLSYIANQENLKEEKDLVKLVQSSCWGVKLTRQKSLFFYNNTDITEEIYLQQIDDLSSALSLCIPLRQELIPIQRDFYSPEEGLIIEGRDSGTVIFPKAPLKIFLKASAKMRAQRRAKDRKEKEEEILLAQTQRDQRDQNRPFAPVKIAKNSLILDSEKDPLEDMVSKVYQEYKKIFL